MACSPASPPTDESRTLSREQLLQHARAAGADGETNGNLPLARRGAGGEQTREIRARDEQHQADHAHEDQQRLFELTPQARVALRPGHDVEPHAQKLLFIVGGGAAGGRPRNLATDDLVKERLQSGLGALRRHTRVFNLP